MHYQYEYMMEDGAAFLAMGVQLLFGSVWGLAMFVLTALGLYAIARRRDIRNPWLAWVPVANVWLLGSLSDQYRYVVKGEYKSKRKSLLVLHILQTVLAITFFVIMAVIIGKAFVGAMNHMSEERMMQEIGGWILGMLGTVLPMAVVTVAYLIIYFMALNDVYRSCDPGNSVLYLVLSILFGVTIPFFLFFNRKKDAGMPPRRGMEPEQSFEPAYEQPVYAQPVYEQPVYEAPAAEPEQSRNFWEPEENNEENV